MQKNTLLRSVSALRKVSHWGSGVSFLRQSHLQHAAKVLSPSWASPQSMVYMGASLAACILASWLRHLCSLRSSSLALASPLSANPTITPSRKDWMVSWLWLMGTLLNVSAAPLSAPFWCSNSNWNEASVLIQQCHVASKFGVIYM